MCTKKLPLFIMFTVVFILQINLTFAAESKFHAIYDCVFDTEIDTIYIAKAVMSKDGSVVICYGHDNGNTPVLYRMNSNGSEFVQFSLPQYVKETLGEISDITISGDGSIAYFYSGLRIYKVVSNSIIQIFDSVTDSDEIHQFFNLQAAYNGNVVFFQLSEDYRCGSVWQIDQNGLNLIKTIDPTDVIHNWGKGAGLSTFAISDNAGIIAFILRGYWDDDDNFVNKPELFLKTHPLKYKQLTFNSEDLNTGWLDISGNGNRVVIHKRNPSDILSYFAIDSSGIEETELAHIDIPGFKDMDYNGSTMLTKDSRSQGRLIETDGSSEFDIFAFGNSNTDITLSYANKVCFVVTNPGIKGVYVGYLNTQDIHLGNPVIEKVTFDPETFPKNNPDAWIKLKAEINNPGGLDEIDYVDVSILYKGCWKKGGAAYSFCQVWFPKQPNDDGNFADEIAGDSIFTTYGKATKVFDDSETFKDQAYVRVVAHNNSKSYAIHDVLLKIENETALYHEELLPNPADYSLSQNFPNPFNPNTIIQYSIPLSGMVSIKLFDIMGRKIQTLMNEMKVSGSHQLVFDARGLSSGVYFYQINCNGFIDRRKMILMK